MVIPPFLSERKTDYFSEASNSREKTCGKLRESLENQEKPMWKTSPVFPTVSTAERGKKVLNIYKQLFHMHSVENVVFFYALELML